MPELSVVGGSIKLVRFGNFILFFLKILPIEIFLELKKGLGEEFSKTGNRAVFEIKVLSQRIL